MGYFIRPAADAIKTAVGLTALVDLARSDGANNGDLYQDSSTGRAYRYKDVGSGMLVPDEWYDRIGNLKTQDSSKPSGGLCYLTLSDTEADLTGRGWVIIAHNAKTTGNPLVIDSTTPLGGEALFTSNSGTSTYNLPTTEGLYLIARVANDETHSGVTGGESRLFEVSNGSKIHIAVAGSANTAGRIEYGTASTTAPTGQYTEVYQSTPLLGTNDGWIHLFFPDDGGGDGLIERLDIVGQGVRLPYNTQSTANNRLLMLSNTLDGAALKLEYYEIFVFEVT